MNARVKTAIEHWSYVAPLLQPARNAKEYAQLVEALDAAIDAGGANEKHPLARLVDYLGDLVAEYEAKDKMPKTKCQRLQLARMQPPSLNSPSGRVIRRESTSTVSHK